MSNPLFIAQDWAAVTFTASHSADASYPLTNLKTGFARDVWKSSSLAANQWLKIDLGSALTIDRFVIEGMSADTFTVQYDTNDDSSFANPVTHIGITPSTDGDPYVADQFSGQGAKRYWRLLWSGTPSTYPSIGQIMMCIGFSPSYPYDFGYRTKNREFESAVRSIALDGSIRTAIEYNGREVLEMTFTLISDADRAKFVTFFNTVRGPWLPFYFIDIDDAVYYVHLDERYNPLQTDNYQLNTLQRLVMRKQLVG